MSTQNNWEPYGQEAFVPYGEYVYDQVEQPAQQPDLEAAVAQAKKAHRRKKNNGFLKFLILLVIVTVGIMVVQETILRLETVYVVGNEMKTAQQVVTVSGLVRGRNMLGIEEDEVAKAFARDHTIIFKGMQKEYPSTIYLYIQERRAVAAVQWLGLLYTLDEEGMVMSEQNTDTLPTGMPVVTGMIAGSLQVGQKLTLRTAGQLEAYCEIMKELGLQLCANQVSEINLADPASIYLVTVEGVTVRLGDASDMRAKIGAVNTAMARLRQWGELGGVLDVTTPVMPKYKPED